MAQLSSCPSNRRLPLLRYTYIPAHDSLDARVGNMPQSSPVMESLRIDEHMKCFETVLEGLNRCQNDDSLIASLLLSPSSDHLPRILEILWEIQRKDSLVGLVARGLNRRQTKSLSSNPTFPSLPDKLNSKNDTKQERRTHLGKLSVLWMQLHCFQVILTDLATHERHQIPRCRSSQRVLNRYFSLSPNSAHRTTPSPYLSRLMRSPSCATAYARAADGFIKLWKALSGHLKQKLQAQSFTSFRNLPILLAQLDGLAQSLNITEAYSNPVDLIKPCVHVLIRQTIDWTLDAYRNAVSTTRKAFLFESRPSLSLTHVKPRGTRPNELQQQLTPKTGSHRNAVKPPRNYKATSRQVTSPERQTKNGETSNHSTSHPAVTPEPQDPPPLESQQPAAPATEPAKLVTGPHVNPTTPPQKVAMSDLPPKNAETSIPSSSADTPERHEVPLLESEQQIHTEAERQAARLPKTAATPLPVPNHPGDQSLRSSPSNHSSDMSMSPIPTPPACSSTLGAGRSTRPATDLNSSPAINHSTFPATTQNVSQRNHHSNHVLAPPSQTPNGSLAPSEVIPLNSGIEGKIGPHDSSSSPCTGVSSSPDGQVSKCAISPASETSQSRAHQGSRIQAEPLQPQLSITASAGLSAPGAGQSTLHVTDKNLSQIDNHSSDHELAPPSQTQDGLVAPSDTIPSVSGIEGYMGPNESVQTQSALVAAAGISSSSASQMPSSSNREISSLPGKHTIRPMSEMSPAPAHQGSDTQPGPRQLQAHDLWRQTTRHSMGPRVEGNGLDLKDSGENIRKKRQRRSTNSAGQAMRKRVRLESIMELGSTGYTEMLLKEFRNDPRLSEALEKATEIATRNECNHNPTPAPSEPESLSDSETGSVLDDHSAQLDPLLVDKLKANAAQFGENEDSHFSRLLAIAASELSGQNPG
ncbi:uncharacterized protein VP01_1527g2 [Puccinia sorghi]|uniref:Uncharacterized protein n=1 Tax=Puccinia sorghi TaxID=27349 RepID=A0A0L6VIL0_9BASI|nr:uncharacterized protein VP01_1527g2 [Puccinia sorghi]